jgi:hypothetical protein
MKGNLRARFNGPFLKINLRRLQVRYLNGAVVALGLTLKVPTPVNRAVLRAVSAAEQASASSPPRFTGSELRALLNSGDAGAQDTSR